MFQAAASTYFVLAAAGLLGVGGFFLDGLMRAVSVRVPHAHVVLEKNACEALRLAGVAASRYAPLSGLAAPEACILADVTVLSKVGNQWRVSCWRGTRIDDPTKGFTVDIQSVLALVDVPIPTEPPSGQGNLCQGMWEPA